MVVTTFNRDYPMIRLATGDLSAVLPASRPAGAPTCASRAGWAAPTRPPRSRACSCIPSRWRRSPSAIRSSAACGWSSAREAEQDVMTLRAEAPAAGRRPRRRARRDAAVRSPSSSGEVELVAPGSLPNDGKVIADERPVG